MKVLHLDKNHDLLWNGLQAIGFQNEADYLSHKAEIESVIANYDGLIIRSRFPIDAQFLDAAINLKFIGRVGAGLENIDVDYAERKGIRLFSAPEGNRTAVAEHAMGMLLSLLNKLRTVHAEVQQGVWKREENRGFEIEGKTVGIIGYGNMGKAFAKRLQGFDCEVIFYDICSGLSDAYATEVDLKTLQERVDVLSLHIPQTPETIGLVNKSFIDAFQKSFWLINTARGSAVKTSDLVCALKEGKVLGAGLDVLEYEKSSFERLFSDELPDDFKYLIKASNVLLSPHVAGWTVESKEKLAQVLVDKITAWYKDFA